MGEGISKTYVYISLGVAFITAFFFIYDRDNAMKQVKDAKLNGEQKTLEEIFKCKSIKNVQWTFEKDIPEGSGSNYREGSGDEFVVVRFNMCQEDKGVSKLQKIYFEVLDGEVKIVKMHSFYDKKTLGGLVHSRKDLGASRTYKRYIREIAECDGGDLELIECSK